jgi:hypothetical protein
MRKQKQPAVNVSIFYGNNTKVIDQLINEKIGSKRSVRITDNEISGIDIISEKDFEGMEFLIIKGTNMLKIEHLVVSNVIFLKNLKTNTLTEMATPKVLIDISSFQPADISYFGAMENVELIACFSFMK